MASVQSFSRRRRSRSTSTLSGGSHHSPENAWRVATKRSSPHHSFNTAKGACSTQKWGVDSWRRSKKRHKLAFKMNAVEPSILRDRQTVIAHPAPTFATTSAEFHLFPIKDRPSCFIEPAGSFPIKPVDACHDLDNLSRLRSNAFWELHRSIAESGEGLVQRMRDYEYSRSSSSVLHEAKGAHMQELERSSSVTSSQNFQQGSEDDGDEIQIIAGELPNTLAHFQKGEISLDPTEKTGVEDSRITYDSSFNSCHSDKYDTSGADHSENPSSHPTLSHTPSSCIHSSLFSSYHSLFSPSLPPDINWAPSSATSGRSSKAIAALSLAIANGAGSLNDYQALVAIQTRPSLEGNQVGEMWH